MHVRIGNPHFFHKRELQARCGLRIGEVLKPRAADVTDSKLTIREPKSGKDSEIAFMPEQIAKRLAEYLLTIHIGPEKRIFPVCYSTVRALITRLAAKFHVKYYLTISDGIQPLMPVGTESFGNRLKVLLRYHDLKTTQIYLGKVNDTEAIRWMDVLHGKKNR